MRYRVVTIAALLLLAGCGDAGESADTMALVESTAPAVRETVTSTMPDPEVAELAVERAPEPATGETEGDLVASILADAVARTGAAEEEIAVIRSEPIVWNDGSLGCPVQGESYTMALVDGLWVVLEIDGVEYDYRANDRGVFRLCEDGGSRPSSPTE